jgi:hypothetical protein
VLFSWYYRPYLATTNQSLSLNELSPFSSGLFDLRGVAFAAWTLTALAIGVLAGMLIRRVVPAIVVTLAVYTALALTAANVLRHHYLSPLLTKAVHVPSSAWIVSQYWTRGGRFAFHGWQDAPLSLAQGCATHAAPGPLGKPIVGTFAQCAAQHGYAQWTRYQPVSRFWQFQWIEASWLLALSALLIAMTIWLVRHRAT